MDHSASMFRLFVQRYGAEVGQVKYSEWKTKISSSVTTFQTKCDDISSAQRRVKMLTTREVLMIGHK